MSHKIQKYGLIILGIFGVISLFIGRYSFPRGILEIVNNKLFQNLIIRVRTPRILFSMLVGFGISVTGLILQSVFKNPLADPGLLGVNQAAGFGAALAIVVYKNSDFIIQLFAFTFGIIALFLTILISRKVGRSEQLSLILSGIAVSALFSAGLGIIKYIADPLDELPSIVFWLLGSLSNISWKDLLKITPILLFCIFILYKKRWRINTFSLEEEVLFSLGIKKKIELNVVLILSVLITTSIVSLSGIIGWVGLIIPNIARLIAGPDLRKSFITSMVIGGIFVLFCDNLARSILPGEIPLGIITAFFGALLFITLLFRQKDFI